MERIKSYNKACAYMFSQLPMYQRQGPKAFKKNLDNIIALCNKLGNPQTQFKSVHIAGTNGKGTVTHLIACGLKSQGYRVGVYTSPHYKDFRERIKIGGDLIPKQKVVEYVNLFIQDLDEIKPSFFEMTVAMAFKYFADEQVDIAVIETGLGGRLDSTNIVMPELSVITNISLDHTMFLGDTLELIAGEKAGIIKPNIPVIIGERQEEIHHVFRNKAKSLSSELSYAGDTVKVSYTDIFINGHLEISGLSLDIVGPFVSRNLTTAIAGLHKLNELGWEMDWRKFVTGCKTFTKDLHFIGRWQWIGSDPDVLADSAHNEGGLQYVIRAIKDLPYTKIHFVLGFVNDKDLSKVLQFFPGTGQYYFAKANIPRGLDAHILKDRAANYGLKGKAYTSIRKALAAAKTKCKSGELIFVGGSIFTVAEVL
jgi:dihydrofolate synthase/folylpolyglutamate synthase